MKARAEKRTAKKSSARRPIKPAPAAIVETVLVMRTCDANLRSRGGFQYPQSGPVAAPDWKPTKECGAGLHGLLWGVGDASLLCWQEDAKWLVLEVEKASIVDLDGKVKFPRGNVVFVGDRIEAAKLIGQKAPGGSAIVSGTATAGDRGTATAGDSGTATAGDRGTATAGDSGTATAGYSGTATAGYSGTATAGDRGTATAGDSGTATAGDSGTARSGDLGVIAIRWWESAKSRWRVTIAYVGEGGVKPNTFYRCDDAGKLVEVVS